MTGDPADESAQVPQFHPVRGRERIDVLDYMRGFAILGIFFMNIPFMAGPMAAVIEDPRLMGWSPADQSAWLFVHVLLEGTQRGMLELLFGAGIVVMTAKAMEPDGPVAVADLHMRRNLWLLGFGLIDIGLLLWAGDILHVYAVAALIAFPFRTLRPRWLIALGLSMAVTVAVCGVANYAKRSNLQYQHTVAIAAVARGEKLNAGQTETVKEWTKLEQRVGKLSAQVQEMADAEAKGRSGDFGDYAAFMLGVYGTLWSFGAPVSWMIEAFFGMLLGMAAWKLGFIQGKLPLGTYLKIMLAAYVFGLGARTIGLMDRIAFSAAPSSQWITQELARLAVTVGHVALFNLLALTAVGRGALKPFRAAGKMAFTLYFLQQIIGIFVFYSPIGLHLPGAQGWVRLYLEASLVFVLLLIFANVWLRFFANGPMEWAWRSLSYGKRQPFRLR